MNDKLRAFRDQIEHGDDVMVRNHGGYTPRKARVVEVLRSAVRVHYYDKPGKAETVVFKDITRVEDEARKPPPPAAMAARTRTVVEVVELPPPPPPPRVDDLTAWLDMGRDMAERMRSEIERLQELEHSLRCDALTLEQEANTAAIDRDELARKLKALEQLTGGKP